MDKPDQIEFKMPTDRLALSMLAMNRVKHGDVFVEDGYVYDGDKNRIRKWFGSIDAGFGRVRLWEPKLKNIAMLEAKRWKYLHRARSIGKKLWEPLIATLREKRKVYGHRLLQDGKSELGFIEYWPKDDYGEEGVSFGWAEIGATPNDPAVGLFDQEAFDLYWEWSDVGKCANRRYQIFNAAFKRAIEIRLFKDDDFISGTTRAAKTVINDRVYWWVLAIERSRVGPELFIAPEDTKVLDLEFTQ